MVLDHYPAIFGGYGLGDEDEDEFEDEDTRSRVREVKAALPPNMAIREVTGNHRKEPHRRDERGC